MSAPSHFSYDYPALQQLVRDTIAHAEKRGASACEVEVSEGFGQSVTVRRGEVETIEYNRDKGLGVTVYMGHRKGHASTSDLSPKACRDTIDAALAIARFTAPDDCAGLPDADMLAGASEAKRDLDLYHPWNASVDEAIELARRCEAAAFEVSPLITNSEGATISMQEGRFCLGNSLGFLGGYPSSRHYIACSVIAGEGDAMQRDDWYSTARDPAHIADPAAIGDYAARRALARRNARRVKTGRFPVLFEAPLAGSLLGSFVHAASGGSLYRKASFLMGALGKPLFPSHISITEDPFEKAGLASSPFDNDGVRTQAREVVTAGVLNGYFLSTYTARKLGMKSTGNAGGCHNLKIASTQGAESLDALIRRMGRGLLVTELLGHGINYVNGDYSRGASGYWVEGGKIAYPVEEITIAGNLKAMLGGIVALGDDLVVRGSKQCGSILIDEMTIAGA